MAFEQGLTEAKKGPMRAPAGTENSKCNGREVGMRSASPRRNRKSTALQGHEQEGERKETRLEAVRG